MNKIICFDINGTLADGSSWSMFEDSIEVRRELEDITRKHSRKEISTEFLWDSMVAIFRKTGRANKEFIHNSWKSNLNLKPGAEELVRYLLSKDYRIYLISCSVDVYAQALVESLNLNGFFAGSNLVFDDKEELIKIISECRGKHHFKKDKLVQLSETEGIDIKDIIFVGDDDNDIEVFKMTGHGIAMDSKNQELIDNSWKQVKSLIEIKNVL